jgi:hypothetical protein
MVEESDIRSYESFPRKLLDQKISRRQFFLGFDTEIKIKAKHEGSGKIPELGIMDDDDLLELIPQILPGTQIIPEKSRVCAIPPGFSQPMQLFEINSATLTAFNLINGSNSLKEIAEILSDLWNLPLSRAFLFTRGLFLSLVEAKVCLPLNNPKLG